MSSGPSVPTTQGDPHDSVPAPMVQVPAETVEKLREALDEYPDATVHLTPESFSVSLMDTFRKAARAARAVVDAADTPHVCTCGETTNGFGDTTPGPCFVDDAGFTVHRPAVPVSDEAETITLAELIDKSDEVWEAFSRGVLAVPGDKELWVVGYRAGFRAAKGDA